MTQLVPITGAFGTRAGGPTTPPDVRDVVATIRKRRKAVPGPVMSPAPPGLASGPSRPAPASLYPSILQLLSEGDLGKMADQRATDAITAESAPIERARKEAAQRALGQNAAAIGFTGAAQGLLGNIGPGLGQAYADAQAKMSNLGLTDGAENFANADAQALGAEGEAGTTWAGQLGQIQGNLGQQILGGLMYDSENEQKDFSQQLIDLASKRPELRSQALDALWGHEMDKLKMKQGMDQDLQSRADNLSQLSGTVHVVRNGQIVDTHQKTTQGRAQDLYEQQFGYKQTQDSIDNTLAVAKLKLQNRRDQAYIDNLDKQGTKVNAAASGKAGYLVDVYGNPLMRNGKRIPVVKTTSAANSPANIMGKATKGAKGLLTLQVNPSPGIIGGRGKYMASTTAKGVFSQPDPQNPGRFIRTTNDPAKAARSSKYSYAEALGYLQQAYPGLTEAQAKKALRAAGWTQ